MESMKGTVLRRGSKQKKAVLSSVVSSADHPSADQIFLRVRKQMPGVSLSTVYRNLGILVQEGELIAVSGPGAEIHYDHLTENHCHVQCRMCGKVCDVLSARVDFASMLPVTACDFNIDGVSVTFTGICEECNKTEKTGERNGS
jgi:Fe2+ or Zn2+ uptake regulation protein